MSQTTAQLRKAAVLVRSLDPESAAAVLSRLSPEEAKRVRLAIQSLGEIDPEERADVSAEFRRSGLAARENLRDAVELELASAPMTALPAPASSVAARSSASGRPFEFLEQARVESLVPYLAREHVQTVAVVLSYLPPARAAQVLAALPEKQQAATLERLSVLGETDPSTLQVLERELADWVARQQASRTRPTQRIDTVNAILAAADQTARGQILANLVKHNQRLATQLSPPAPPEPPPVATIAEQIAELRAAAAELSHAAESREPEPPQPEIPAIRFDDLVRFDAAALGVILKSVDSDLLVLALVGASDELVARITTPMPPKVAKAFRRRLHNCGPTRLRDVEAAQAEVARIASQFIHARRARGRALAA
jgi:flagellar motor switch protein FliG